MSANNHHVVPKERTGKRKGKKVKIPKRFHDCINVVFGTLYGVEFLFFVRGVAFLIKRKNKLVSKDLFKLREEIKELKLHSKKAFFHKKFNPLSANFQLNVKSPKAFSDSWNLLFGDLRGKEIEKYIKSINKMMEIKKEISWEDILNLRDEIKKLNLNNDKKTRFKLPFKIKKPSFIS